MHLAGQHERRARPDAGYAMAVLLAGIAIMGIVWTLVVPVWKQAVQREKEAELIFRAGQYARAVALYQRKYANAFPPSVDVLLREKFLRKKYKDPVTNGEFRTCRRSSCSPSLGSRRPRRSPAGARGRRSQRVAPAPGTSPPPPAGGFGGPARHRRPSTLGPGGHRLGHRRASRRW